MACSFPSACAQPQDGVGEDGRITAPGLSFTGILMNPEDSQTYFAKMLQGYNGRFLYTIPFTPEPHDPAFVGVF